MTTHTHRGRDRVCRGYQKYPDPSSSSVCGWVGKQADVIGGQGLLRSRRPGACVWPQQTEQQWHVGGSVHTDIVLQGAQ
jgi:hypothetical protein